MGGRQAYACDMQVVREFLPGGYLREECPLVPCMAEPGDDGRILHLAWWVASGRESPGRRAEEILAEKVRELDMKADE